MVKLTNNAPHSFPVQHYTPCWQEWPGHTLTAKVPFCPAAILHLFTGQPEAVSLCLEGNLTACNTAFVRKASVPRKPQVLVEPVVSGAREPAATWPTSAEVNVSRPSEVGWSRSPEKAASRCACSRANGGSNICIAAGQQNRKRKSRVFKRRFLPDRTLNLFAELATPFGVSINRSTQPCRARLRNAKLDNFGFVVQLVNELRD